MLLLQHRFLLAGCLAAALCASGCSLGEYIAPSGFGPGSSDYAYDLSGGYELSRSSAHQVRVHPKGSFDPTVTPTIPAKVVEIAWDHTFILSRQQVMGSGHEPAVPARFQYWILDVNIPKRYGPCNLTTLAKKRAELGIPENLQLKDVRSYRR